MSTDQLSAKKEETSPRLPTNGAKVWGVERFGFTLYVMQHNGNIFTSHLISPAHDSGGTSLVSVDYQHPEGVTSLPMARTKCWVMMKERLDSWADEILSQDCFSSEAKSQAVWNAASVSLRMQEEINDADRRAGAAERALETLRVRERQADKWVAHAKEEAGYHEGISFESIWAETLALAKIAKEILSKSPALPQAEAPTDTASPEPPASQKAEKSNMYTTTNMVWALFHALWGQAKAGIYEKDRWKDMQRVLRSFPGM